MQTIDPFHARAARASIYVLCVATVTSCGFADGDEGSLRTLFEGELPKLDAPKDPKRDKDAGTRDDDDTRQTSGRTTTGRDTTTSPNDSRDRESTTTANTTSGRSTAPDDTTGNDRTSNTNVSPTTEQPCEGDTSGLTLGDTCTRGVGACQRRGEVLCRDGALVCGAGEGVPFAEQCNGVDDDCDGETDEDSLGTCRRGMGGCEREGDWVCVDEEAVCNAQAAEPVPELCNGLDDDCDDIIDEDFNLRSVCSTGVGGCARTGEYVCANDVAVCDAEAGDPETETCNGQDDDCDGETDEGFDVGGACTRGVGACAGTGVVECANGEARCNAFISQPGREYCNGEDDDCDGEVDSGNVCPGDVVQNTKPFTDGVWYTASTSSCGGERILQFWPELNETTYYSDFPCYASAWSFRPMDWALFVLDTQYDGTLYRHHQGDELELVPTPECDPRAPYFFDGDGEVHYPCHSFNPYGELRRGSTGELVRSDIERLYQVTSDGRMLVQIASQLTLLNAEGEIIDTYAPEAEFEGTMTIEDRRVTVNDNDLFLLYRRQLLDRNWELDMFRINEDNELLLVRRLHFGETEPSNNLLPLSDGSIFAREPDPDGDLTELFRRYAPDGTDEVVWRESEATFTTHGLDILLVGPRL